ncbi:MAG: bifunctional acetate--CoA ligase family protein/GNAT family N-acetyltransferase [Hyphomicrobiaceae bacterium]|nr:bifunctional acetate--CoA ligase family protein/GNAT family N-acetyltransferase [Hyphomicrobiaceae bacterium]
MTIRNLQHLLAPKSVALIGASPEPGSVGLIVMRNLRAGGFAGPLWLVNPRHREIEGMPCHPSVDDLPDAPDLAVIATPPRTVPQLIDALGRKGTRAAVVITAGIRDDLRQAMLDASKPYLLRIQGPNSLGLMVPGIGLDGSFSHRAPLAGDLAFLSQSGALITGVVDWAADRQIGFSHVVSLGDMADVDFGDLLDFMAGDPKSRAILLYMESVTHAPKFLSAARRAARSKPVIVVKAGRHEAGSKAALSHTGALTGADSAYDAAFRRAGLLRVLTLQDLFDAAEILARMPASTGERLAILTNGGGAAVLAVDRLMDLQGSLANLSDAGKVALDAVLPPTWSHANPVDVIGDAGPERYSAALEVLLEEPDTDAILVMNCPTAAASTTEVAKVVASVLEQRRRASKPVKALLTNWLGEEVSREARQVFASRGIASFKFPANAIEGFMQLVRYTRAQEQLMRTPPSLPEELGLDTADAGKTIAAALKAGRSVLSEVEGKSLLAAYGIPTVPTEVAATPAEAEAIAARLLLDHDACVVKVLSDDISHKSDVGGVRLGLERAEEARMAAEDILARVARLLPDARVAGFTVQPMIRRPRAHELIAGMAVDRTFGPVLLFGAGGTSVEVVGDTAQALPPLDMNLAHELMRRTRIWRLLQGYRDRPAADIDRVAEVLVRLGYLVARHPEIRELDINPLIADDSGVIALDARVRVEDQTLSPRVPMAMRPYPSQWAKEIAIESIGQVRLRPIRPEDEPLYADFFRHLTRDDQRLRFFSAGSDLSRKLLARLTQIDYAREMAFVALARDTGRLLGVARFVADPDYTRGEYAILVRSDLKGRGLGWQLMRHLIDYARAEGLEQLFGSVLAENTTMLQMCADLGFSIGPEPDDTAVRHVVLDLARQGDGLGSAQ